MEDPQNDADWNFRRATRNIILNITMTYTEFEMSDFCILLELSMYPSLGRDFTACCWVADHICQHVKHPFFNLLVEAVNNFGITSSCVIWLNTYQMIVKYYIHDF